MTDKIQQLEKELNRLEKEYGDIGAYKEYGQVMREMLSLLKSNKTSSLSSFENRLQRLESIAGKEDYNIFKAGVLQIEVGVMIHNAFCKTHPDVDKIGVEIKGDRNYHAHLMTREGKCEKKVPGGNYSVKAMSVEQKITVDGDTKVELKVYQ